MYFSPFRLQMIEIPRRKMTCQSCRAHSNFMIIQAKIITLITYPISFPLCISSLLLFL